MSVQVSELLALKIENALLKMQILQAQAQVVQQEQFQAIEAARKEVEAGIEQVYDAASRTFVDKA